MRFRIPLLGYIAACVVGALSFTLGMSILDGEIGASDFIFVAMLIILFGGIFALPIAVPTIIVTERWKKGPWWVFVGGGALVGPLIVLLLQAPSYGPDSGFRVMIVAATTLAGFAYWLIAWRLYAPAPAAPPVEVFE